MFGKTIQLGIFSRKENCSVEGADFSHFNIINETKDSLRDIQILELTFNKRNRLMRHHMHPFFLQKVVLNEKVDNFRTKTNTGDNNRPDDASCFQANTLLRATIMITELHSFLTNCIPFDF